VSTAQSTYEYGFSDSSTCDPLNVTCNVAEPYLSRVYLNKSIGDLEPYDHPPKVVVFCNCLKHPIPDNSTPDKKQLAFISAILNTSPVTKSLGITIFSAARVSSKTTLPPSSTHLSIF
jgi:hypothetical protein